MRRAAGRRADLIGKLGYEVRRAHGPRLMRSFAAAMVISALLLAGSAVASHERACNAQSKFTALSEAEPARTTQQKDRAGEFAFPQIDWDALLQANPNVVGWISIPGTNLSQPIVQASSSDPQFYLSHDLYRSFNIYGCPYLDAGCAKLQFNSACSFVFGHFTDDGAMFSAFSQYQNKEFAQEHPALLLQTPTQKRRLRVCAADVVASDAAVKRTDFASRKDFLNWWQERMDAADLTLGAAEGTGAGNTKRSSITAPKDNLDAPERGYVFCTCTSSEAHSMRIMVYAVDER